MSNVILKITIDKSILPNHTNALTQLLKSIAERLSWKTDVSYTPSKVIETDDEVYFTFNLEHHNESNTLTEIVENRYNSILKSLKQYNYPTDKSKYCGKLLSINTKNFNNILQFQYIKNNKVLLTKPLVLPGFKYKTSLTIETNTKFNFKHLKYIDSTLSDYGLYIFLNRDNYTDYNYGYNFLHIYEHLMCDGIDVKSTNIKSIDTKLVDSQPGLKNLNPIITNGCTYPTNICKLFAIYSTPEGLVEAYRRYVEFHEKCKNINYWRTTMKPRIKTETIRTWSETITNRNLTDCCRSDSSIFDKMEYDYSIFALFSQSQYTILTTSNVDLNFKLGNIKPTKPDLKITKPITPTFNRLPLNVIRNRSNQFILDVNDLNDKILKRYNILYGKQVAYVFGNKHKCLNDVISLFSILELDDLKYIIKHYAFPCSNIELNYTYLN